MGDHQVIAVVAATAGPPTGRVGRLTRRSHPVVQERIDEAMGGLKEAAGMVTGYERQEAEGRAEAEAARLRREASGTVDQVKGAIKQGVGDLTGDERLKDEGSLDKAKGAVKKA
jgi:uncharacterized protein YjbJ (UPF0337 family)